MSISERAVVSKSARLGKNVEIGPFAVIEDDADIGNDVKILSGAHICSGVKIGDGTEVHMGAVLGNLPQDLTFDKTKKTGTVIGRKCVIREYATINRSTKEDIPTTIGDGCYLMAVSHVGHDCHVGNNVVIANCALLAGHVTVEDNSFISGNVVIHQFCRIGTLAIIGGFSGVNKDVPPYMLVRGPSVVRSVNLVGLRRAKFSRELIGEIQDAYKFLYMSDLNTTQAIEEINKLKPSRELSHLVEFIKNSKRGICKYKYTDGDYFE